MKLPDSPQDLQLPGMVNMQYVSVNMNQARTKMQKCLIFFLFICPNQMKLTTGVKVPVA